MPVLFPQVRSRKIAGMLDQLHPYMEYSDSDGESFIRLDSIEFVDDDGILTLSVEGYDGQAAPKRWSVRARGLLDYKVSEPFGDMVLHEHDHVLARQHTDTHQSLSFRGVPRSTPEAVGQLLAAHRQAVDLWIPFEKYFNRGRDLGALLDWGMGQLADGPSFLVQAYAEVLETVGVVPSLLQARPAVSWNGVRWIENKQPLVTLLIGDSFFVAERFEVV